MQILIDFVPLILHVNQKKTYYKLSHNICFTQAYNTTRRSTCVFGKALLVMTVVRRPGKWRSWVYKRMVWGPTWYRVLWWPEISEERLSLCEVSWQSGKNFGAKLADNRICWVPLFVGKKRNGYTCTWTCLRFYLMCLLSSDSKYCLSSQINFHRILLILWDC